MTPNSVLRGRCVSCGLLSKRNLRDPSVAYEVSQEDRERGQLLPHEPEGSTRGPARTQPWCFVRQASLPGEVRVEEQHGFEGMAAVRTVIDLDRRCPKWVEWQPLYTPKEHYEDMMMAEMECSRRAFEVRQTTIMVAVGVLQIVVAAAGVTISVWLAQHPAPPPPIQVTVVMPSPVPPLPTAR